MAPPAGRIAELREKLAALEAERGAIEAEFAALTTHAKSGETQGVGDWAAATEAERVANRDFTFGEKIALFRDLFRGRADVFPVRRENPKTGKSGYSPACDNEWRRGVCRKPKLECSVCHDQAFTVVTNDFVERRLRGISTTAETFVMGV